MRFGIIPFILLSAFCASGQMAQQFMTKFELTEGTETVTYQEGIQYYRTLAENFKSIEMLEMGTTDSGKPLHLVLFNESGEFDLQKINAGEQGVLLINNGIHAGETDGIDASMLFMRDLAEANVLGEQRSDIVVAVVPFFNVGGALNRNSTTRVNQNGPKSYGFRGNARNFNLNRDFTKGDTRNMWSFWEIFHALDPDFFLDTHVSNGADYQYTITLIANQKDKLSNELREFQEGVLKPALFQEMAEAGYPMTPYVNVYGRSPDDGFAEFADWARYSSGYAALFQSFGFMTETHMLKPYKQRVEATYRFILSLAENLAVNHMNVQKVRSNARQSLLAQSDFPLKYVLDSTINMELNFKGFEASYKPSEITAQDRLYYDRTKPFEKKITYWNTYRPSVSVKAPKFYVISESWYSILDRLRANGVKMIKISTDSLMQVEAYKIKNYESIPKSYEGHHFHYDIKLEAISQEINFPAGTYIIPVDQYAKRYIIEMLEPLGEDSFFKWNFFDTILERKEYFSGYVFEELALEILRQNPQLEIAFRRKQKEDEQFSANRYMQLDWIYQRSKYYEKEHMMYPVFRIK